MILHILKAKQIKHTLNLDNLYYNNNLINNYAHFFRRNNLINDHVIVSSNFALIIYFTWIKIF